MQADSILVFSNKVVNITLRDGNKLEKFVVIGVHGNIAYICPYSQVDKVYTLSINDISLIEGYVDKPSNVRLRDKDAVGYFKDSGLANKFVDSFFEVYHYFNDGLSHVQLLISPCGFFGELRIIIKGLNNRGVAKEISKITTVSELSSVFPKFEKSVEELSKISPIRYVYYEKDNNTIVVGGN